jgi:hypothetical protein
MVTIYKLQGRQYLISGPAAMQLIVEQQITRVIVAPLQPQFAVLDILQFVGGWNRLVRLGETLLEPAFNSLLQLRTLQLPHSKRNKQRHSERGQQNGPPRRPELVATKDHVDNSRGYGKIGPCPTNVDIMLFAKIIIGILLGLIVLSLGASLFSVLQDKENSNRSVKMLTVRIVLSIITFIFIVISFYMGWLQPHGLVPPA